MSEVTENELKAIYRLVWEFRQMVADYWPTPEPLDALRYAFTEAGEAIDAMLRENRPGDRRNRPSEVVQADRLDEWADCAIMLITALPGYDGRWHARMREPDDTLAFMVGGKMHAASSSYPEVWDDAWEQQETAVLIGGIANLPGIKLGERVIDRLQRISRRHILATAKTEELRHLVNFFETAFVLVTWGSEEGADATAD